MRADHAEEAYQARLAGERVMTHDTNNFLSGQYDERQVTRKYVRDAMGDGSDA